MKKANRAADRFDGGADVAAPVSPPRYAILFLFSFLFLFLFS
jgi:hypothetical protein